MQTLNNSSCPRWARTYYAKKSNFPTPAHWGCKYCIVCAILDRWCTLGAPSRACSRRRDVRCVLGIWKFVILRLYLRWNASNTRHSTCPEPENTQSNQDFSFRYPTAGRAEYRLQRITVVGWGSGKCPGGLTTLSSLPLHRHFLEK